MSFELAQAIRTLVVANSAADVSANVVRAFEELTQHFSRIVGDLGMRALLARSIALTSVKFPWILDPVSRTDSTEAPWSTLTTAMEQQDPRVATDAFVELLSTLVALLGRLIGDDLVVHLLHELWPDVIGEQLT